MSDPAARPLTPPAKVAVIGLGNMGRPMAACLAKAGYDVRGYDSAPAMRERFAQETGRTAADSLEAAVDGAKAVVTILPNGKVVAAVVAAMTPHLSPGAIIVEMSSSEPMATRRLGEAMAEKGFGFVDAPVSGGVRRAIDGSLAIMAGGDAATLDIVEPLLKAMGRAIFRTGALGSGHAVKALNNYVSGAGLVAALEAVSVGKAFGLDPDMLVDVLNASTGKNNSTEVKLKQFVLSEAYNSGFFIGLMAKDIRTAQHLAEELGVATPLGGRCADLWDEAARTLGDLADHTEINRFLTQDTA
ncbi:NAD(P)-dependent oxidoreductase [Aquabacter spiritensis]|uniref:3-hydroxyisobutyrate dehydrogenase n=1 Tax=Aquabacter spiritensis TaxID=933073 RepID=A0A4R3LV00_9HYPH|nr:NAD(P)-dependent oxidoreductase [Aquabacter spiritensis]TCT04364.1 3-hydroxyisobutyrate dehydrogenase [Aquabacter spiritensis]